MASVASSPGKGIHGMIKHLLEEQYSFVGGDRIQDILVDDLIHFFRQCSRDPWHLEVSQTLWFAAHRDEKPGPGKTLAKMRVVPVILSVVHEDDRQMRINGYSPKEVLKYRVTRILREAYAQNGVLTQADVAEVLGVSAESIRRDIREYQREYGVILPYRGTIHDIGPSVTHKKVIITMFLRNIPTLDIARMTQHTEEACDRYIKSFKKVRRLYGKMKPPEIAHLLEMSERLVMEYVTLIEEQESIRKEGTHGS